MAELDRIKQIVERKEEHIRVCLEENVEAKQTKTLFNDVHLINDSLPELDLDEIDTSTTFLGHKFSAPLMVGAISGGAPLAEKINKNIAEAVQELGLGMVVGSQRAGLYDEALAPTYSIVRDAAPDAFIGSNIGGGQLSKGLSLEDVKRLVQMVGADAFYIHLNPAQEVVQSEGDTSFSNVLSGIRQIVSKIGKPVVVKEVGFGISGSVAKRLEEVGTSAIEVSGAGGTSFPAIEQYRAEKHGMRLKSKMGLLFWDWGIPTAASVRMVSKVVKMPIVSSGGVRNGLDIAKSLAIGASLCATALPVLKPASISSEKVKETLEEFIYGLKCTMLLTGSRNISEMKKAKYVVTGELKDWEQAQSG